MFPSAIAACSWMAAACCVIPMRPVIPSAQLPNARQTESRPKDFAPGVRIDWQRRTVEADARVVMRSGPLELLACRPRSKEHESVLATSAAARNIYLAMGLIGLSQGSPVRYDPSRDRYYPPAGDKLSLRVRFRHDNLTYGIPAEDWLVESKTGKPPKGLAWVFSGSRNLEDGRFAADSEGTVICVVDFDTALISVGELHSPDNEALWLSANTGAIPPIGTECTLLICAASAEKNEIQLSIEENGVLMRNGHAMTAETLRELVGFLENNPDVSRTPHTLILSPRKGVTSEATASVVTRLREAGLDQLTIEIQPHPSTPLFPVNDPKRDRRD